MMTAPVNTYDSTDTIRLQLLQWLWSLFAGDSLARTSQAVRFACSACCQRRRGSSCSSAALDEQPAEREARRQNDDEGSQPRQGLEAAILSHFVIDVIVHVIRPLVDPRDRVI